MSEYCVVIGDASRARFFTLEPSPRPKVESGPRLVEHEAVVNPESASRDGEVFAATRPGSNRSAGGPAHQYDDHRANHHQEFARRFARRIAGHAGQLAASTGATHLVLVAGKRMLGLLRQQQEGLPAGMTVHHLARDMTKMSAQEIHERLAADNLVPACNPPLRMQ